MDPDAPEIGYSLIQIGRLQTLSENYGEAEKNFKECVRIFERKDAENAAAIAVSLENLSFVYRRQLRWTEAAAASEQCHLVLQRYIRDVLPILSENEQLDFLVMRVHASFHSSLSIAMENPHDSMIATRSAEWALNGNALTQEALAQSGLLARDSKDNALKKTYEKLRSIRKELAMLTLAPPLAGVADDWAARRQALTDSEHDLAKQIANGAGRTTRAEPRVRLTEVRKRLPMDAVLVEFARVDSTVYEWKELDDFPPARYAAWIVPPTGKGDVQFFDLGEADKIDDAIDAAREAIVTTALRIGRVGEVGAVKELAPAMKALAALTFEPLADSLKDYSHWVLNPDASLWLVPWCALPLGETQFVVERHTISYVVSGRDLVSPAATTRATAPLVLANPDYEMPLGQGAAGKPTDVGAAEDQRAGRAPLDVSQLRHWGALDGTADEAKTIVPPLAKYAGTQPLVRTGREAREEAFKNANNPRVLVLSTHGFFLADQPDAAVPATRGGTNLDALELLRPKRKKHNDDAPADPLENPLLRCGLVLAGANHAADATADGEDGILTGLEIVGTDLRGTELVVLSACETGLGQVRNGEGVAGLRQAFQLAGARTVVASLWQIPDLATADLMGDFFAQMVTGKQAAEALRTAQQARIQVRRKAQGAAHPFYWAAFTSTGPPTKAAAPAKR